MISKLPGIVVFLARILASILYLVIIFLGVLSVFVAWLVAPRADFSDYYDWFDRNAQALTNWLGETFFS